MGETESLSHLLPQARPRPKHENTSSGRKGDDIPIELLHLIQKLSYWGEGCPLLVPDWSQPSSIRGCAATQGLHAYSPLAPPRSHLPFLTTRSHVAPAPTLLSDTLAALFSPYGAVVTVRRAVYLSYLVV